MKLINIYTDGACSGNQNKENIGGYGAVLEYKSNKKEIFGSKINTTNNIMELTAVIEALKILRKRDYKIRIFSDSSYIVNCINEGWYHKWRLNDFLTSKKAPVENKGLWIELLDLYESFEDIEIYFVKGHLSDSEKKKWYDKFRAKLDVSMDEFLYIASMNKRADELANQGISKERGKYE